MVITHEGWIGNLQLVFWFLSVTLKLFVCTVYGFKSGVTCIWTYMQFGNVPIYISSELKFKYGSTAILISY